MIITHKICMDLTRRMLQPPIQVMQDDQYSRELEFLLTANGEPWEIPEDFSAMIRWHRESDKVGGSYDILPDGSLAYSKRENILTVKLMPQICASPGQVYLTIMLASASAVAHTFTVAINAHKNPGLQESIPAPEPDVYQKILYEYSMMSARVNNLASLEEGSTTGDLEIIDGRMAHTGQVHTNIGSHIRHIGAIAGDLYGLQTVAITRTGEVAAEAVAMYATSLQVVGAARYLEKILVPVQLSEDCISSVNVRVYNSEEMGVPLAAQNIAELAAGQHQVELAVGGWFAPGERIVISVDETEGNNILLPPAVQEAISADWLRDYPGTIGSLNEDTGGMLFDQVGVRFVGELIFFDTLRKEVLQLEEKVSTGITTNPDIHAEYFIVTDDGVVSLKPEYRGANDRADCTDANSDNGFGVAGSKNAELPKHLIIPEIVNGVAVSSLAKGIFSDNLAVVNVTLPEFITSIPYRCFDGCNELKNVYGTENIKTIGHGAFQSTSVVRLKFPKLEKFDDGSTSIFQKCGRLVYIDIGNVTVLPDKTFNECPKLNAVRSKNGLTSVGASSFSLAASLKQANVSNLTNIGNAAFLCSGMQYDWDSLQNCTFGDDATVKQSNPTDFWSACNFTACENPLPTFLSQNDARWTSEYIGESGVKYSAACWLMCHIHTYCGLHNLALSTVEEFENIVNGINPGLLNTFTQHPNHQKAFMESLGLNAVQYSTFNQTVVQALYDALAAGRYAIMSLNGKTSSLGHVVTVYGINEKGELLIADSVARGKDDDSEPTKYTLPFQNVTAEDGYPNLFIVSM